MVRLIRAAIWYNFGRKRFTKGGYEANSAKFDPRAIPSSLSGRVYVVTGANSGIGMMTTAALVSRGAEVHMLCRSRERAEQAREDIAAMCASARGKPIGTHGCAGPTTTSDAAVPAGDDGSSGSGAASSSSGSSGPSSSGSSSSSSSSSSGSASSPSSLSSGDPDVHDRVLDGLHIHIVDMSDLSSVRRFASDAVRSIPVIDAVVNNAGVMKDKREETGDGHDYNFATNVLGPALLTELLMPQLASAEPKGRVVMVSSGGMLTETLDAADPQLKKWSSYDGTRAYAQNKRAQVYLTAYWAKAYGDGAARIDDYKGVGFYSCHPGWVDTAAVRTSMPDFHKRMEGRLRDEVGGADTVVYLAAGRLGEHGTECGGDGLNGRFFFDREPAVSHLTGCFTRSSIDDVEKLWEQVRAWLDLPAEPIRGAAAFAHSLP